MGSGRLPAAFMSPGPTSFVDFLRQVSPDRLPNFANLPSDSSPAHLTPEATTIVAVVFSGGVVLAGDRRARPAM